MTDSRIPGFYRLSLDERRRLLAERAGVPSPHLGEVLEGGGIGAAVWDKVVENVVGTYALPFTLALNFRIDAEDRLVPMVVEEPSVVAAASNAARMVRAGGGFWSEPLEALMIGQIEIREVTEPAAAVAGINAQREELLRLAREASPGLVPYGGGPREIEVRDLGEGLIVVHVLVDCCDAMGANMVNSIAEALGPRLAELARGVLGLRILSNLADRRRVRVRCQINVPDLVEKGATGDVTERGREVADAIVAASRFAERDPYRAVTHNKGIMNGLDAVVIATGNDWRAVEAGAHAYAARSGVYRPLSSWRREGDTLSGSLELPLALGTVGGTLRVQPAARLALELMGVSGARALAATAASAGLASNLAALRALATEGIQRGHMALHARSVAVTVGASGDEVDRVAARLIAGRRVTLEDAAAALADVRRGS